MNEVQSCFVVSELNFNFVIELIDAHAQIEYRKSPKQGNKFSFSFIEE